MTMSLWTKWFRIKESPTVEIVESQSFQASTTSNTEPRTIHDAIMSAAGGLGEVQVLLNGHPDLVFSEDGDGWTPLHHPALHGEKGAATLLLANKADVNATNNIGNTP